jgi:hypothetical protein
MPELPMAAFLRYEIPTVAFDSGYYFFDFPNFHKPVNFNSRCKDSCNFTTVQVFAVFFQYLQMRFFLIVHRAPKITLHLKN